jgi:hypothetical protein
MVWHAKITSVDTALNKTNEWFNVTVLFHEDDLRTFTKIYTIWIGQMTGYATSDFKTIVQKDLDNLTNLDTLRVALIANIGKDI